MGIFFDKPSVPLQLPGESIGPTTGFVQNTMAAYDAQMLARNSNSKFANLTDAYQPIVDALNEDLPVFGRIANPIAKGFDQSGIRSPLNLRSSKSTSELEDIVWTELSRRRETDHNIFPDLPQNRDDLMEGIKTQVTRALAEEQDVAVAADPWGMVGQFVGAAGAAITDPPNLLGMLIGAGEVGILRTIAVEALIGGAVEVPTQASVMSYYAELGIEYTPEDFIKNVGAGAVGAAGFAGGIKLTAKGISKTWNAVNKLTDSELKGVIDTAGAGNSQVDEVLRASETQNRVDAENPLKEDVFSNQTYRDVVGSAEESIEAGTISDTGFSPMVPQKPLGPGDIEGRIPLFRPGDLLIDPKAFQFKAEADLPGGISRRLEGVEEWDPVRAGEILVWEGVDGKKFVADGHQRIGLANRIMEQNPDIDIEIPGHVLREADGVSAADARIVAATKNIAQGTGTAVDAAKILRVDPTKIRGLPQTSALVKMSRELTELSPDAFGMVINEIVPANFAAIVGRLAINDPEIHAATLGILAKAEPRNVAEAEKIVRDVIAAGVKSEKQLGLFGEEIVTVSLFRDRAKILDQATQRLRNDMRVFSTLINDAENIETAGNKLSAENNLQRKEQNVKSLETLQALAHRKGAISDALTAASRQHADGAPLGAAVDQFVDAIRRRVELGDFEGVTTRPGGSIPEPTTRDPASPGTRIANELESLKKWEDPEGKAVQEQIDQMIDDLQPTPVVVEDIAIEKITRSVIDLSLEELELLIKSEVELDKKRLVKAFGSEKAAKDFERLDRLQNSSNPVTADKAAAEMNKKFGDLTDEQEQLVFGTFDGGLNVEELKDIARVRQDAVFDELDDSSSVAGTAAFGLRKLNREQVEKVMAGRGTGFEQAAFIEFKTAFDELKIRGHSSEEIDELLGDALVRQGFNKNEAFDVLFSFKERDISKKGLDVPKISKQKPPAKPLSPEEQAIIDETKALAAEVKKIVDEPTIIDVTEDADGNFVIETGRVGDVLDEMKKDNEFLEQLEICS